MSIEIRLLGAGEEGALANVAPGVFDAPVRARWARAFLADARHHLIVARERDAVVGMITAVDYVHPDKARKLWINEIGVAPGHRRRGIGRQLLQGMLRHGRTLGCTEAWVVTEKENTVAHRFYESFFVAPDASIVYAFPLDPGAQTVEDDEKSDRGRGPRC